MDKCRVDDAGRPGDTEPGPARGYRHVLHGMTASRVSYLVVQTIPPRFTLKVSDSFTKGGEYFFYTINKDLAPAMELIKNFMVKISEKDYWGYIS